MAYIYMPLNVFWNSTPIEIDLALKAYYEAKIETEKAQWERTRTQIYFNYIFTPSSKRKVSYNTFKRDFLPFKFDELDKDKEPMIDDEAFANIQDFFKKKTEGSQK